MKVEFYVDFCEQCPRCYSQSDLHLRCSEDGNRVIKEYDRDQSYKKQQCTIPEWCPFKKSGHTEENKQYLVIYKHGVKDSGYFGFEGDTDVYTESVVLDFNFSKKNSKDLIKKLKELTKHNVISIVNIIVI